MIPAPAPSRQPPAWQRALQQAITDPAELLEVVGLGREWLEPARAAARLFPLKVPRGYAARMRRGDPRDPLLLQVLPLGLECRELPGYVADPVGDLAARAGAGVLRKYHGRALLITTGACAVHCVTASAGTSPTRSTTPRGRNSDRRSRCCGVTPRSARSS